MSRLPWQCSAAWLLALAFLVKVDAWTSGGQYCHCDAVISSTGCIPVRLEPVPVDETVFSSLLAVPGGHYTVAAAVPLPRLVLRAVSGGTGEIVPSIDDTVTARVSVVSTTNARLDEVPSTMTASFRDGMVVFDSVFLNGQDDTTAQIRVEASVDMWYQSDSVTLYNRIAQPTIGNTNVFIELVADNSSYFKSNDLAGLPPIVLGLPLPPVRVRVVDKTRGDVEFLDGRLVTARAEYTTSVDANITLSGGTAAIEGSIATFPALTLENNTVAGTPIRFVFEIDDGPPLTVGPIEGNPVATNNYRIAFGDAGRSTITPTTTAAHAALGFAMAPFAVTILDSASRNDESLSSGFVVATCDLADLRVEGSRAPINRGVAVFENLAFTFRRGATTSPRRAFTVRFESASVVSASQIVSPPIYVWSRTADFFEARRIEFQPFDSFVTAAGKRKSAIAGVPLPAVRVRAMDARGERALGASGTSVRVSASVGQALAGTSTVALADGVATFRDLVLLYSATQPDIVLTFEADGLGTIATGAITVALANTPLAGARVEEAPESLLRLHGSGVSFATASLPAAPVVIQILDALDDVDEAADDVVVEASSGQQSLGVAVSKAGRAVFPGFLVAAPGEHRLTFDISTPEASPIKGLRLEAGVVVVEPEELTRCALAFDPAGHIKYPGHRAVVAAGVRLPRIGVRLVSSAHRVSSVPDGLRVRVTVKDGDLVGGDSDIAFVGNTSTAWAEVTLSATPPPVAPRLCFTIVRGLADSSELIPGVNRTMCSGELSVTASQRALGLEVYTPTQGVSNTSLASDVVINVSTPTPVSLPSQATVEFGVRAVGAAGGNVLPTTAAQSAVTVKSDAPADITVGPFEYVSQASPITREWAAVGPIRFAPDPFIQGYFSFIRVQSAMTSIAESEPLLVGPLRSAAGDEDTAYPVVVAEVLQAKWVFNWARWRTHLLSVMNLDSDRIRLVRIRPGASAVKDTEREWQGTRVEFQFLPPTTASINRASAAQLTQVFLSLRDPCIGLNLRRTYGKVNDTSCDLYRLDEQLAAARRCISVSPPEERCTCYRPLFTRMGAPCGDTTQLKTVCASLRTCPDDEIQEACADFRAALYLQYLIIFGYAAGAVIVLLLVYGYISGFFERLRREKLKPRETEEAVSLKRKEEPPAFDDML